MMHVLIARENVYDGPAAKQPHQSCVRLSDLPCASGASCHTAGWCDENLEDCSNSIDIASRSDQWPAAAKVPLRKHPGSSWSSQTAANASVATQHCAKPAFAEQQQKNDAACWAHACNRADLLATIRSEQEREADLHPGRGYLSDADPDVCVTLQMRMIVTSWMCEVAFEFRLQQETLFLAAELLDRFLAASPSIPKNVLQLVAVSCIFVASKQEEVTGPSVEELTDISANCFLKEDLLRMEMILLDTLDWRIKSPTAYVFLHLLCQGMQPRLPPLVIATAAYFTELSLLDYSMLPCSPSLVAGAAVLLAEASHSTTPSSWSAVQELTGHSSGMLHACMHKLLQLQHCADAAHTHPMYQPLVYVRDKYGADGWLAVSTCTALLTAVPLPPVM